MRVGERELLGIEKHRAKVKFGLRELGLLDGPPLRGASTVVNAVSELLSVRHAAFLMFDDEASTVQTRASSRPLRPLVEFPIAGSLSEWVRTENHTLAISATEFEAPLCPERKYMDAGAFVGAPVYGPDTEAVGVLAAFDMPRSGWNSASVKKLENLAHLISQEIMLRASFQTLRLMSAEAAVLHG